MGKSGMWCWVRPWRYVERNRRRLPKQIKPQYYSQKTHYHSRTKRRDPAFLIHYEVSDRQAIKEGQTWDENYYERNRNPKTISNPRKPYLIDHEKQLHPDQQWWVLRQLQNLQAKQARLFWEAGRWKVRWHFAVRLRHGQQANAQRRALSNRGQLRQHVRFWRRPPPHALQRFVHDQVGLSKRRARMKQL